MKRKFGVLLLVLVSLLMVVPAQGDEGTPRTSWWSLFADIMQGWVDRLTGQDGGAESEPNGITSQDGGAEADPNGIAGQGMDVPVPVQTNSQAGGSGTSDGGAEPDPNGNS